MTTAPAAITSAHAKGKGLSKSVPPACDINAAAFSSA